MRGACVIAALAAYVLSLGGLNPCTTVGVRTTRDVDSATAHPGDFFPLETIGPIKAGTRLIIPAHTRGYGVVAIAAAAGSHGQAGALVLEPRYLMLPGGTVLGVVLDHYASEMVSNGRSGGMPGYLGVLPVPGLGIAIGVFNYFHHGQNVVVKKGTAFSIFPADGPQTQQCQEHPR